MDEAPVIADCGDSAVVVRAAGTDAERKWEFVHALADAVEAAGLDGVYGAVPAYDSLLVEFDCTRTDHATVREAIRRAALGQRSVRRPAAQSFVVPVVYGGEYGPDLPEVARQLGISEREVVELHCAAPLTIRCLGAPAGAPMMDGPAFPRPVPRLGSPRTSVPPGSIAVAGRQAVICPVRSPGGWPLLGRTPLRVLDLAAEPFTAYRPGDRFRFVPIAPAQWDEHRDAVLVADHG
jgi:KipI family sensor histidine kinase inhibitor